MDKKVFVKNLGLAVYFVFLSLFPTASAWAQKSAATTAAAQGPQQVVVTNTTASPVPVAVQTQFYQATQQADCTQTDHADFVFNVPSGKTLLVRHFNVFGGSYNATDNFGVYIYADSFASFLGFSMQPVGGYFSWSDTWATNQVVQMSATQTVKGRIGRGSNNYAPACSFSVTISGELI